MATVLCFRLSDPSLASDVLHELSFHNGITTHHDPSDDPYRLRVELTGDPARLWEVRATVRLFDPAVEETS